MVKSYLDLDVWKLGRELAGEIYKTTAFFPKSEIYGMISQLRRAAVSVPSNIAEGHARASTKEFMHFISISIGSLAELETQLLVSYDIGFIDKGSLDIHLSKVHQLQRMAYGLYKSLRNKNEK